MARSLLRATARTSWSTVNSSVPSCRKHSARRLLKRFQRNKGFMQTLSIDGNSLTLAEVREVADHRRQVALAARARKDVEKARALVESLLKSDRIAYAVNTGVGKLSDVRIRPNQIRELQVNLVRSHRSEERRVGKECRSR